MARGLVSLTDFDFELFYFPGVQGSIDRGRCIRLNHHILQQSVYAQYEKLHTAVC